MKNTFTFTLTSKYRNKMIAQLKEVIQYEDKATVGGFRAFDYYPSTISVYTDVDGLVILFKLTLRCGKVKIKEVVCEDQNYRSNMTSPLKSLSKKETEKLTDRINAMLETI